MNTRSDFMKYCTTLFFACASLPGLAFAQCGAGVNTGGGNCTPPDAPGMPGYSDDARQSTSTQVKPQWADQWGAVVIDDDTGDAGTVVERDSEALAVADAMRDCKSQGAKNCRTQLTFYNQCAAVAWGSGAYGVASNATEAGAHSSALKSCSKSVSGCKIVFSACSVARRVR